VLFPSQEFGAQEKSTGAEVVKFADSMGFIGTVMSLGDVRGELARTAWKFLYEKTGASQPKWNFSGKFLVSRAGEVKDVSGAKDIAAEIKTLLSAQ